jgi:NAD(P)-dependent dehydrogenase (short-subunit alcohol dehydrogenase family)
VALPWCPMSVRVAVVTGANRGLGFGIVRGLLERGFDTVLGSRDLERGESAAAALPDRDRVRVRRLDVTDQATIDTLAEEISSSYGHLDVLVNNAGIDYDTWQRAETADLDVVHQAFETNVFGAWRMCRAFIPLLRSSPHSRLVNVSSEGGSITSMGSGPPAYDTSKAALNALTRTLAAELRGDGILVNAICPGWVATDMGGPGGRPVDDGAASVLWGVDLPDDGPTGGFFRDGAPLAW